MNLSPANDSNVYSDPSEKRSDASSGYKEKVQLNFEVFIESVTMQQLDKKEPMNLEWKIKEHKFPAVHSKNINIMTHKIYFVNTIVVQAKLVVEQG